MNNLLCWTLILGITYAGRRRKLPTRESGNQAASSSSAVPLDPTEAIAIIKSGDTIFLRSHTGRHIEVENETVRMQRYGLFPEAYFIIESVEKANECGISSGDIVYFKAHTGCYMDVEGEDVRARMDEHNWCYMELEGQRFVIEKLGGGYIYEDDTIFLKAESTKYIDVEDESVRARWGNRGELQALTIQKQELEKRKSINVIVTMMSGASLDINMVRERTVSSLKKRIHKDFLYPILVQKLSVERLSIFAEDSDSFEELVGDAKQIEFQLVTCIQEIQKQLLDENPDKRLIALRSLVELAQVEISQQERLSVLACVCIRDDNEEVRNEAMDVVLEMASKGDESIVTLLCLHFDDGRADVRMAAVKSLAGVCPEYNESANHHGIRSDIMDRLIRLLRDRQACVQFEALDALGQRATHGDENVVTAILPLLRERLLWAKAAETLGKVARKGDARVTEPLRRLIFLPEATLEDRRAALLALHDVSEVGDEDTLDVLLDLIQNDLRRSWSLIHEALWVLARKARTDDGRAIKLMEDVSKSRVGQLDNGREVHLTHVGKAAKDAISCLRKRASQSTTKRN